MEAEHVPAEKVSEGDVIRDPAGARWITVNEIRALADDQVGVLSFYGEGPDDRITVAGDELVERKRR
jgi:hypothetical protein